MLNDIQRQMLVEATMTNDLHMGADNPELERVIEAIKRQSPEKFHDFDSLSTRRFINEPRPFQIKGGISSGIRNRGFLVHASAEIHKGWAES